MTIKELENQTGMARANVRFYEQEGLIAPARQANGYRDYSQEDVRTLEKIKLLRQIGLDIDTIRQVQRGTLTLEQALFVQGTKLEGDRVLVERAAEVCRELGQSGVEYGALDPAPWLRQLEAPERPALPESPLPRPVKPEVDDTPRACYHPWQRWLARLLDMRLYSTFFEVLWLVPLRDWSLIRLETSDALIRWLLALGLLMFTLAVEPLWLHFWGWTPGKWILGLKLRTRDGEKLSLAQAWNRSWRVFGEGYGWSIPIYGEWRFWKCREAGLAGRDCNWDGEEDYRYTKEERRYDGVWVYIGVTALCFAALFLGLRYSELPVNRGDLTVAEFIQNYNHYVRLLIDENAQMYYCPQLDENGRWVPQDEGPSVFQRPLDDGLLWSEPEFTVENNRVTAVTLHWSIEDTVIFPDGARETLAMLALSGAAEGTGLFRYDLKGRVKAAEEFFTQWGDLDTEYRGLRVVQTLESSGYLVNGSLLLAEEDEPHRCEKTVTIALAN